jgi:hypothetical protein
MNRQMKKWVTRAAAAGFLVGVFWVAMGFVFFSGEPSGLWSYLYPIALIITCPAWYLPIFPFTPVANAVIYALAGWFAFKLRESARPSRSPAS